MPDNSRIDVLEERFRVLEAQIRADLEALAEILSNKAGVPPMECCKEAGQNEPVTETAKTITEGGI